MAAPLNSCILYQLTVHHVQLPGPSCWCVLAELPHTTSLGFQTGHPDRRVLVHIRLDSKETRLDSLDSPVKRPGGPFAQNGPM